MHVDSCQNFSTALLWDVFVFLQHPSSGIVFCTVDGTGNSAFDYGVWGYILCGHCGPTQPVEFSLCMLNL